MIEKIGKIVEHIEKNYHEALSSEIIEKVAQVSEGHLRNEFSRLVGMPLDKYRARRELTLIINEVNNSGNKFKNSNILPWTTENAFYSAFKNEFGIPPMKFIHQGGDINHLQPKLSLEDINKITLLIKEIINKNNYNSIEALKFILRLKPYFLSKINAIFTYKHEEFIEHLIRIKYGHSIDGEYFFGKIPNKIKKESTELIDKYYDLEKGFFIDDEVEEYGIPLPNIQYIFVKRDIVRQLMSSINFDEFIKSIKPEEIVTMWEELMRFSEPYEQGRSVKMPNDFINSKLFSRLEHIILRELVFQEQGFITYRTFEDLKNKIEFDYDSFIDNQAKECKQCIYDKNKCNEEETCKKIENMSPEEQETFYDKPDYEYLTLEKLYEVLYKLFINGMIYLK